MFDDQNNLFARTSSLSFLMYCASQKLRLCKYNCKYLELEYE